MRAFVVWVGIAGVAACAHSRPNGDASPALYPSPGFGRAGCFAGPSLQQFYNGPTGPRDSSARAGPWLVLDSLSSAESHSLDPRGGSAVSTLLQATMIYGDDTSSTTVGTWRRPTTDSVVIHEYESHPPVTWRLRWERGDLTGEAALSSDLMRTLPNGKLFSPTYLWSVGLLRVSCKMVPRDRPQQIAMKFAGNADTTLILGSVRRDVTGDGVAESLQVIAVGRTVDSLDLTFTIESSGEIIYRRPLAPMTRTIGFDAERRTVSAAEHRTRLQEFGGWFFEESKFQTPAAFVDHLQGSAPRHLAAIPDVITRDRRPGESTSGADIWREILASRASVFSFSPGGDEIIPIAWSARARRFYRLTECC